jgi:protein-tyrosine phosphatase
VDSAGTSSWHEGEHPDPRSIQNANRNGVDISKQRSRPFRKKDLEHFDRIFVMDATNYRDVMAIAKQPAHKEKIELFCNIKWPGSNKPVPDPYYSGEDGFQLVFELVSEVCDVLIENIRNSR